MSIINLTIANMKLYAYTALLRQVGAKYDDVNLHDCATELETMYSKVSSIELDKETVLQVLPVLHMIIINLHIDCIRNKYIDITPICEAYYKLLNEVEDIISSV